MSDPNTEAREELGKPRYHRIVGVGPRGGWICGDPECLACIALGYKQPPALEQAGRAPEQEREKLLDLRRRSRQPLETDISDYSDEWCEGFLAGQTHALDVAMASFGSARG